MDSLEQLINFLKSKPNDDKLKETFESLQGWIADALPKSPKKLMQILQGLDCKTRVECEKLFSVVDVLFTRESWSKNDVPQVLDDLTHFALNYSSEQQAQLKSKIEAGLFKSLGQYCVVTTGQMINLVASNFILNDANYMKKCFKTLDLGLTVFGSWSNDDELMPFCEQIKTKCLELNNTLLTSELLPAFERLLSQYGEEILKLSPYASITTWCRPVTRFQEKQSCSGYCVECIMLYSFLNNVSRQQCTIPTIARGQKCVKR